MEKEKLEQLRKAFQNILEDNLSDVHHEYSIEDITKELVYEVKIRITNRNSKPYIAGVITKI